MPIYEYECSSCGALFESLEAAGTESVECERCGAAGAKRRLSMFGPLSRQPTPGQRRWMEDARGTDRDGARTRFKEQLGRARGGGPDGRGRKR